MQTASILIVEDERIVAFHLKQQLQALGYQVVGTVVSGEQAIDHTRELKPDLILMDIHLEGAMDGIEAATEIQAQTPTPIIFLTAYAEDETLYRAQASLPCGYLVKPCETRELHATIQMALSRRNAEQEVIRSRERLELALSAANLGVWEWDTASSQMTFDGQIDAMFGGQVEAIGENVDTFLARVYAEDRANVKKLLDQAIADDIAINSVFQYLYKSGVTNPHREE